MSVLPHERRSSDDLEEPAVGQVIDRLIDVARSCTAALKTTLGSLCALLRGARKISVLWNWFPFGQQGFQPIGNGELDIIHRLLFCISKGAAPGQRRAKRAVPSVFLLHQHGVTVSRHLFLLFPRPCLEDFEGGPGGRGYFRLEPWSNESV